MIMWRRLPMFKTTIEKSKLSTNSVRYAAPISIAMQPYKIILKRLAGIKTKSKNKWPYRLIFNKTTIISCVY